MEILQVKDIYKDFSGLEVLTGVTFTVKTNEKHAIIGPNGAGKTTLFNIISGKYRPSSGSILFKENEVGGLSPYVLNHLGMCRSFQITNIFQNLTVFENVSAGVRSHAGLRYHLFKTLDRQSKMIARTEQIIEQVGLAEVKQRPAHELSYGQQRALEIGIALSSEPELVLLDEPTAGMTLEETEEMVKLMRSVTENRTLMIIEHDMEVVFSLADTISVLHNGTILASDRPEAIRSDLRVKDAYLGEE
ncbi:MAG: ABC transporter ATP-binding protein [Thermodesulfobacteriota bacterium]|jgi:branched-chain amino acid transport system ATP-binding protein